MFTTKEIEYEVPEKYEFSQGLLEKIRNSSVKHIIDEIDEISSDEARFALQKALKDQPSSILSKFRFSKVDTDGVHDVTFGQQPIGDFYFSDLISSIYDITPESSILDFGCSTGRVIRNLRSVFEFSAYGCDPRDASIAFNKANFEDVTWFVSNTAPPIVSECDFKFDMVFAISVWSHFSEEFSLLWFDEMHKRLNSGGQLLFTTHGTRSVYHFHDVLKKMPTDKAEERLDVLRDGGIHFMSYPTNNNDLDNRHWGMTFMSRKWLETSLQGKWKISDHRPGMAMRNQDLYVLTAI